MASSDDDKASLLDRLQNELDPVAVTAAELAAYQEETKQTSDQELKHSLSRLTSIFDDRLADGGFKLRKKCQLVKAELARRAEATRATSKSWLQKVRAPCVQCMPQSTNGHCGFDISGSGKQS